MILKNKQKKIQWFDDYIKEMISSQTSFDVKKIKPIVALKTNSREHNQF